MAAKSLPSAYPIPSEPEVPTKSILPIMPRSRIQSPVSSPIDDDNKVEWHVCPNCQSAKHTESTSSMKKESPSSTESSPTTSEISQVRSLSFARLGHKIKEVLSHTSESTTTTTTTPTPPTKARLTQKKTQKKKPKKKQVKTKVITYGKGYEELGADHWADDY